MDGRIGNSYMILSKMHDWSSSLWCSSLLCYFSIYICSGYGANMRNLSMQLFFYHNVYHDITWRTNKSFNIASIWGITNDKRKCPFKMLKPGDHASRAFYSFKTVNITIILRTNSLLKSVTFFKSAIRPILVMDWTIWCQIKANEIASSTKIMPLHKFSKKKINVLFLLVCSYIRKTFAGERVS